MTPPEVIPPPAIDISVVIITYEKAFELGLMLKALSRQTYDMQGVEVIIIDDGSQDDTESAARSYRSVLNIEYVRMPHIGIRGRLRNEGAARARGRRLIFLDSDMVAECDLIERHAGLTAADPKRVSLGTRRCLVDYDRRLITSQILDQHFEIIRQFPAVNDERTLTFQYMEETGRQIDNMWCLLFSHNFCVWKSEFDAVGGFDDAFSKWWGAEDVELGYRLQMNGCRLALNPKALCYHLYHNVDRSRVLRDLKNNLAIFFQKHRSSEVELFTQEYKLWAKDYHELRLRIRNREYELAEMSDPEAVLRQLRKPSIVMGVNVPAFHDSDVVSHLLLPAFSVTSPKVLDLIGIMTGFSPGQFKDCVVSERYRQIDVSLFEKVLLEARRISEKVIVVGRDSVAGESTLGEVRGSVRPAPKVSFVLSNIAHHVTPYDRSYYVRLAAALRMVGINAAVQYAYDPFQRIPRNIGFYRSDDPVRGRGLEGVFEPTFNIFDGEVPCIVDPFVAASSQRGIGNRFYWQELRYKNYGPVANSEDLVHYDSVLFRRAADQRSYVTGKRAWHLPVGIDLPERSPKARPRKRRDEPFTVLWANPFVDEAHDLKVLVEAFLREFGPSERVRLRIAHGGMTPFAISHPYLNDSFQHHVNGNHLITTLMQREQLQTVMAAARNDSRIEFVAGDHSEEVLHTFLLEADCVVDTNASQRLSPVVLDAVALGCRPLLPDSGAYDGYLPPGSYVPIATNQVSGVYCEPLGELLFPHKRHNYRYFLLDKMKSEVLRAALRDAYEGRTELEVDEGVRRRFCQQFDWLHVAEEFKMHLASIA